MCDVMLCDSFLEARWLVGSLARWLVGSLARWSVMKGQWVSFKMAPSIKLVDEEDRRDPCRSGCTLIAQKEEDRNNVEYLTF